MEINNFYTVTVYEKGAEVVRLYQSLLGVDGFRRGMDLYFERHDGQAVTTEDFLAAMAEANDRDLAQMQRWYDQAGTPRLSVRMDYDEATQSCTLHCSQTSDAEDNKPYLIPLSCALLLPDGSTHGDEQTLLITEAAQSFHFANVTEKPLPSLLRGFSAPVELDYPYSADDDAFLMRHDSDAFNRWAAAQRLAMTTIQNMLVAADTSVDLITMAFEHLLRDEQLDDALKAEALILPSEADIAEACIAANNTLANPSQIHRMREQLRRHLAASLRDVFEAIYQQRTNASGLNDDAMQQRKLKNVCLSYLATLNDHSAIELVYQQFTRAENMTDQYAALSALSHCDCKERTQALAAFEQQWQHEPNVMDKWFAVQAASSLPDTLAQVQALMTHPCFDLRNPNKVRALIGTFAMRNPAAFHTEDARGYVFIADQILALDKINPQVTSRLARAFTQWRRIEEKRSSNMRSQLQRIAESKTLSSDLFEIVNKSLTNT